MVSQVPVDRELCIGVDSIENKDGDSSLTLPLEDHNAPNIPVKKQTRQWAAWTRQEEESFFAALRQVGKNFEKITSRIQSKNKDQVRHYYYRLVRRMNKLLGPELSLDAKNSKDTIAAMLRWWSLLEKYSCKASKLHLKPRRFKIFVETLENQLLKDRKKNIKKRLSTGENNSSVANIPAPNQSRVSGHEDRGAKMALVDSQNIQKVGTGKGSLLKRNVNIGMKRTNCKADPTSGKAAKQRRKAGLISTTAYKRWEEAAIAGVSLVADAAEHLERVDTDKEIEHAQETLGHDGVRDVDKVVQSLPASQSTLDQNNLQNAKLKLQLFPIDECTQKALEMGNHNPHLELTLSTRKKISSVVEHLNRKWGNSSLLCQEMMLFPYWAHTENLVGYQRWTKDSPLCAADVYNLIGSPPIFRLRYGWFSVAEIESATAQALSCSNQEEQNLNINIEKEQSAETEKPSGLQDDQFVSSEQISAALISPSTLATRSNGFASTVSNMVRETGASAIARHVENAKDIRLSGGDWADSLTSISMGDLLSESAQNMDVNCAESPVPVAANCFQQLPFTCDSFDAAIAAHIYKHHNKVGLQQGFASHGPSIWDAEETCDAFAFHKSSAFSKEGSNSLEAVKLTTCSPLAPQKEIEELSPVEKSTDVSTCGGQMDYARPVHSSEEPTKDYGGLTDMYWPDSLGPLDFDIPSSSRYHSNDLILSDSLGGLNRVMASSLDAFQNCSFLGYDKKEGASTVESHQSASFSDFKVSGEV